MPAPQPKRVAAIITEYRRWSHADVILGMNLKEAQVCLKAIFL